MEVSISLFAVVVMLLIIIIITEHLFNWGLRTTKTFEMQFVLITLYIARNITILGILHRITH